LLLLIEAGALLTALLAPGCGVSSASSSSSQVAGRVTYAGKPVTGGLIIFTPKDRPSGNWGAGLIEKNGRFSVTTHHESIALEPGSYRIFFRPPAPKVEPLRAGRLDDPEEKAGADSRPKLADPKPELPDKFYDPETSGLWVVIEREPNWIEIDMQDAP
jgi:hypothetical protein